MSTEALTPSVSLEVEEDSIRPLAPSLPRGGVLHVPPPPPPVDLTGWLSWVRSRDLADETIRAYSREIRKLAEDLPVPIDTATTADLRAVFEASTGKPSTVSRRVAGWASYYRWLVRTEQRSDDPTSALDRPKTKAGLPRPVDDIGSLLDLLDPTMQNIVLFLWETGLRISEACAVDVEVPAPDGIVVLGKGRKERYVPLSDLARECLDDLGGKLPWRSRTIQRRLREIAPGITPHRLRHSFATDMANDEVDITVISKLLGHASVATTQIYAETARRRLTAAVHRND